MVSHTPTIVWAFISVMLFISTVICVMLLRDSRNKQRLYQRFENNLNEFIVVLSQKMEFLYGLPTFMWDPLFYQLSHGRSFSEVLGVSSWNRMKSYFDEIEKHLDMPFLFSLLSDYKGDAEGAKSLWYEMRVSLDRVNAEEFYYVCFIRNISRENESRREKEMLQERFDSLLQNTGDFLWSFDVEDRSMKLLTPMMDDEHRVIPQSVGYVDIHKMMPEGDYALLDSVLNDRVKDYRNFGFRGDPFETIKVRFYGPEKSLVWYGLRGKLCMDENDRLVLQGTARRMDVVLDNSVLGGTQEKEALLPAALAFPDIRMFWMDRDYKILGCNQAFATDFQIVNPREIYGKSLNQVVSRDFLPYISRGVREIFNTGRSISWKGRIGKKDHIFMYNAVPLKNESNKVQSVLSVYLVLDQEDLDENT
ncbi:PAS domain-containing protein [uncultured Fibrobacter sp.]|uniref:PAS domain-containing protein n=1 Tax=uncultured Fibrobacter sp. TaxID=261512 RepID=UPI0025F0A47C|nr:PAS domain-containing protein [uncultured Fibrobacter sp.]